MKQTIDQRIISTT